MFKQRVRDRNFRGYIKGMWQCVVCDTLWHTIWSKVSCDNVWYVTMIHYGTLYGLRSHVTMCGMSPWYTMAHYMVHVLMCQCVVCNRDTLWHSIWSIVSCDNVWYVTMIHYGTLYGPCSHVIMWGYVTMIHYGTLYGIWSHVTMWGVCDHDTLWHTIWSMVSCDNVGVCDHDTLWHTIWSMVSCDNVGVCDHDTLWHTIWSKVSCDNEWYVTMIHYGTLYGPWSHVIMWGYVTMIHYGTLYGPWSHVIMWGGGSDCDTQWHTIWYMVSCDNVGGMWLWYTMAHYMVHVLMW